MGIDGSYDTVLVLFQNSIEENDSKKDQSGYIQMLPESVKQSAKIRSLGHVLPCQLLIKAKKRGKIPETFTASGVLQIRSSFPPESNSKYGVQLDQICLQWLKTIPLHHSLLQRVLLSHQLFLIPLLNSTPFSLA